MELGSLNLSQRRVQDFPGAGATYDQAHFS